MSSTTSLARSYFIRQKNTCCIVNHTHSHTHMSYANPNAPWSCKRQKRDAACQGQARVRCSCRGAGPPKKKFTQWRVRATLLSAKWKWDVFYLVMLGARGAPLTPQQMISSGYFSGGGYEAQNASTDDTARWGGREDDSGEIWLGISLSSPEEVTKVSIKQRDDDCYAISAVLEYQDATGSWVELKTVMSSESDGFSLTRTG